MLDVVTTLELRPASKFDRGTSPHGTRGDSWVELLVELRPLINHSSGVLRLTILSSVPLINTPSSSARRLGTHLHAESLALQQAQAAAARLGRPGVWRAWRS